jgi:DNA recombination protein RmuC
MLRQLVADAVAQAAAAASQRTIAERDQTISTAMRQLTVVNQQQLSEHTRVAADALAGRHELIDQRLGEVQSTVASDISRLTALVQQLGDSTAQRFGEVDRSLQAHAEVTQVLSGTAQSIREALASSNARGQWGERMAEDVLRMAGLVEGVSYVKRTAVVGEGTGIPDFTFPLPKGHVLFMDVKFPMASYLRYLDATTDAERSAHRAAFVRDVRGHVRELARRDYARTDDRPSVDSVLMFVPNESLASFIHEADSTVVDEALRSNVVICSPLTLFAYLGVIRQAFDNFAIEQTSREILGLLGKFGQQWSKYTDSVEKVRRNFATVSRAFDDLATTRLRALERPLREIESIRRTQQLPIDGQLFELDAAADDDSPAYGTVRELGA